MKSIAKYTTNAGQSFTTGVGAIVDFEDKSFDTKSEVTTGSSWKFTAKEAGYYRVNAMVTFASNGGWGAGETVDISIRKNTTGTVDKIFTFSGATTAYASEVVGDVLYLSVGDYVDIYLSQTSGGTIALYGSGVYNWITVEQIG